MTNGSDRQQAADNNPAWVQYQRDRKRCFNDLEVQRNRDNARAEAREVAERRKVLEHDLDMAIIQHCSRQLCAWHHISYPPPDSSVADKDQDLVLEAQARVDRQKKLLDQFDVDNLRACTGGLV